MAADRPTVSSRTGRVVAYLAHNWQAILVDLLVITAWVIGVWTIAGQFAVPLWFVYLVLFVGVLVYSRITRPWGRPYVAPDLDAP